MVVIRDAVRDRCGIRHPAEWWKGIVLALDTETTGVDPAKDRIVELAMVLVDLSGYPQNGSILEIINPGVPIPQAASDLHGLLDEQVQQHGVGPKSPLTTAYSMLKSAAWFGWPLVVFNATYDLPLLWTEMKRHGVVTFSDAVWPPHLRVIDPLCIDRHYAPWRKGKGKRELGVLAREAGVWVPSAHSAWDDALTAANLARWQANHWKDIQRLTLDQLHLSQGGWHTGWQNQINGWLRKKGEPLIDELWPYERRTPREET